jgi:mannose-1-phosphate guanylyltransferase
MKLYAVIMAGGVGSRFWPRSRAASPKQLLNIFGEETMIQGTVNRLKGLVNNNDIFVITNKIQKDKIIEQLPEVPAENIIAEPFGKNTAPCVALSAAIINKLNPDGVILTLPADHLILDEKKFRNTLTNAAEFAYSKDSLVTIGITPTRPETGYGYIQMNDEEVAQGIHKVETFAEKPNFATAKRFVKSGDFFWNSGMFIWRSDSILNELEEYMPDLYNKILDVREAYGTDNFEETLLNIYGQLKSISIDYGVMEKSKKVYLIKGDFIWNDVGSWEAVYQLSEQDKNGNVLIGDVYTENTLGSYIKNENKFTAVIGVENVVVIETDDALLIVNRNEAQNVKNVVDYLKMKNKTDLV